PRPVESTRCPEIDVLHARLLTEFGRLETQGQPAAVADFGFAIDQQTEPFVKTQAEVLVAFELFTQAEPHAEQAQRVELVERLVDQHGSGLQQREGLLVIAWSAQ